MQYHAIPYNTMQYHAIPRNTMQYHAIPCIINNCWRSLPLPCGQYKAILVMSDLCAQPWKLQWVLLFIQMEAKISGYGVKGTRKNPVVTTCGPVQSIIIRIHFLSSNKSWHYIHLKHEHYPPFQKSFLPQSCFNMSIMILLTKIVERKHCNKHH